MGSDLYHGVRDKTNIQLEKDYMNFTNCHGQQTMKEVSKSIQKDPWQICLKVFFLIPKRSMKNRLRIFKRCRTNRNI